jgi:hypothetical protein
VNFAPNLMAVLMISICILKSIARLTDEARPMVKVGETYDES